MKWRWGESDSHPNFSPMEIYTGLVLAEARTDLLDMGRSSHQVSEESSSIYNTGDWPYEREPADAIPTNRNRNLLLRYRQCGLASKRVK